MAPKLCVSVLPIPQVGVMASANVELGLCTDLLKEHRWLWKGECVCMLCAVRSSIIIYSSFRIRLTKQHSTLPTLPSSLCEKKGVGGAGFGQLELSTSSELCMTAKSPTFGANVALWSCELSSEGTQATYWHSVSWAAPRSKDAHAHAHAHVAAAEAAATEAGAAAAEAAPLHSNPRANQAAAGEATTGGAVRRRLGASRTL